MGPLRVFDSNGNRRLELSLKLLLTIMPSCYCLYNVLAFQLSQVSAEQRCSLSTIVMIFLLSLTSVGFVQVSSSFFVVLDSHLYAGIYQGMF